MSALLKRVLERGELDIQQMDWLEQRRLALDIWAGFDEIVAYQHVTDAMMLSPDDAQSMRAVSKRMVLVAKLWGCAANHPAEEWRGLSLSHIEPFNRIMACVVYADAGGRKLSQESFNFWTLGDVPGAQMELKQNGMLDAVPMEQIDAAAVRSLTEYSDREYVALMTAFERQLVADAAKSKVPPAVGEYIMTHEPFPALDACLRWDSLRLIVAWHGIWATFVHGNQYAPVYWSPGGNSQAGIVTMFTGAAAYAVRVLLAGIWRDACVVQERWALERERAEYRPKNRKKPAHRNPVVLPRLIRHIEWGSSDDEREHIIRASHGVRGHYRHLGNERSASQQALDNAELYGLPAPPEGYTFVSPHLRGQGDAPAPTPQRVVCRGLQTVKIALG